MRKVLFAVLLAFAVLAAGCIQAETSEETCLGMTLEEARQIASASSCVENGSLKDTYVCNENTGTWWLDLDIEKPGCNPACVVDIGAKTAEINWRCTGLIIE